MICALKKTSKAMLPWNVVSMTKGSGTIESMTLIWMLTVTTICISCMALWIGLEMMKSGSPMLI